MMVALWSWAGLHIQDKQAQSGSPGAREPEAAGVCGPLLCCCWCWSLLSKDKDLVREVNVTTIHREELLAQRNDTVSKY